MNTTLMMQCAAKGEGSRHYAFCIMTRALNSNSEIRTKKAEALEHGYYQQQYFTFCCSPKHVRYYSTCMLRLYVHLMFG